jgi:hypothetical protein
MKQPKQQIGKIPAWLLVWAKTGIQSARWDELYADPRFNPAALFMFTGIEQEIAEALIHAVESGVAVVSDTAVIDVDASNVLVEALADMS